MRSAPDSKPAHIMRSRSYAGSNPVLSLLMQTVSLVHSGTSVLPSASCFRLAIGVSGPIAAGKTAVCRHLEGKGFSYARFSAVIDDMLRQAGLPIDRSHQQAMGEQVHLSPGQRWLCQELMQRVPENVRLVVIDGLRFPDDHAFFAERLGSRFLHLHIRNTIGCRPWHTSSSKTKPICLIYGHKLTKRLVRFALTREGFYASDYCCRRAIRFRR